jgi:RNA polymerase sigma-70 factor (ECF subfamily)
VFALDYDEIAEAVGRTAVAVRQIAHRARSHVAARRPRSAVSQSENREALLAFRRAVETGDMQSLLDRLAPGVVFLSDGGGVVQAALTPIVGAESVATLLSAGLGRIAGTASIQPAHANGHPALIVRIDGQVEGLLAVRTEGGLITGLYFVRNPEKLSRLEKETALRR